MLQTSPFGDQDESEESGFTRSALDSRAGFVTRQNIHAVLVEESNNHDYRARRSSISDCSASIGGKGRPSPSNAITSDGGDDSNAHNSLDSLAASLDAESIVPEASSLSYIGMPTPFRQRGSSLTAAGDKQGAGSFVYGLCHASSPQEGGHFLLPRPSTSARQPYEIDFLRRKGAFSLPSEDVCDDLVRYYFHHVHYLFPVVDAISFLNEYVKNGCQNISLLLIWSMFLAAANVSQ